MSLRSVFSFGKPPLSAGLLYGGINQIRRDRIVKSVGREEIRASSRQNWTAAGETDASRWIQRRVKTSLGRSMNHPVVLLLLTAFWDYVIDFPRDDVLYLALLACVYHQLHQW